MKYTYEISKFIIKNIDEHPIIKNDEDGFSILIKKSKYIK